MKLPSKGIPDYTLNTYQPSPLHCQSSASAIPVYGNVKTLDILAYEHK